VLNLLWRVSFFNLGFCGFGDDRLVHLLNMLNLRYLRDQPPGFLPRIVLTLELAMPSVRSTVWSGPTCVVRKSLRVGPLQIRGLIGPFLPRNPQRREGAAE
jgi:hypothetical protein